MDKSLEITGHCRRNNCGDFIPENTEKSLCLTVVIIETWFNSQTWNGTYHFLIFPAHFILNDIIWQNFTQTSEG